MIYRLFFIFTLLISTYAFAEEYKSESTIINIKHVYQLGDLIIVEDQITANTPFVIEPKLLSTKNSEIRLVGQEGYKENIDGKYIFFNKVTYQIFHRSEGMQYFLPSHTYKIGDENVEVPTNTYWFTRIASSDLNDVLLNALGQVKPDLIKYNGTHPYLLVVLSFFTFLIVLYKKMDFSFIKRMNGPFTKANKKIRSLHLANNQESYDKAILILLDACNKSFGENINSLNIEDLLPIDSKYHSIKYAIKSFVTLTNSEIYSSRTYYSKERFDDICNLAQVLRVLERRL